MDRSKFELVVKTARDRDPVLFAMPSEGPMSEPLLDQAESTFGISLPEGFRWFLGRFGAGNFSLVVIYSLISGGKDSVAAALGLPWLDQQSFFPVADNGVGDYWGFVLDLEGRASAEVYLLDHEVGSVRETASYDDFLEFVAVVGLAHE